MDNFIINSILSEVTAHWFTQQALTALTDNGDVTDAPDSSEVPYHVLAIVTLIPMTVKKCFV